MNQAEVDELRQKFDVPPIDLTFEDSQRRRLCFRNERNLYNRTCDATGENIISIYAPDSARTVYKPDYWYSDAWDALSYGKAIDFTRPFFEQFGELTAQVPRLGLINKNGEDSDYCNMTYGNKHCYLIFGGDFNEDCLYGTLGMKNALSLDIDYSDQNQHCYELNDSFNCHSCQFAFDCRDCSSCYFVSDCIGSSDCILSTNLINKQYCIENVQYSKEDYLIKKAQLIDGSRTNRAKVFDRFLQLRNNRSVRFAHISNCADCTGDYLKNSKNCSHSFDVSDCENLHNIIFAPSAKDSCESTLLGHKSELIYNSISVLGAYNIKMSCWAIDSRDITYSIASFNSKNLFGCVGLRQKQFCILNKQYTEDEYIQLRDRIILHMKETGEWGQFFPAELSDFAYNETSAHDFFPLSKEEAMAKGYRWRDDTESTALPATTNVPDRIADVTDSITSETLQCQKCSKNYKILPQELAFYQQMQLPIPDRCSNCRHKRRMGLRNPRQLWSRTCANCQAAIETSYSPDRPERVLCEECYLKEIH